jgi:hypothetical protein
MDRLLYVIFLCFLLACRKEEVCTPRTVIQRDCQPMDTTKWVLNRFYIYPNPNRGEFEVFFEGKGVGKVELSLFNLEGRKVMSCQTVLFSEDKRIPITLNKNNINSGVYLLNLKQDSIQFTSKIVIT